MLGTWINVAGVIVGSLLGLLLGRGLPKRMSDAVIHAFALITITIGVGGAIQSDNPYVLIVSIAIGTLVGEALDLQGRIESFAAHWETRLVRGEGSGLAKGFITATLLYCTGAMAVVGSIESGIHGDHTMIFTKTTLDFVASIVLASSLGIGVMFSAGSVLVYQGSIVLLAGLVAPYLSDATVTQMSAVGSVLLVGLGVNMLGVTKLRIMNYVPAIFLPVLLMPLYMFFFG